MDEVWEEICTTYQSKIAPTSNTPPKESETILSHRRYSGKEVEEILTRWQWNDDPNPSTEFDSLLSYAHWLVEKNQLDKVHSLLSLHA
jgi:hypothetical protein